ncbi:unnamed protein product [Closterium sp. Yama58-4]|nr:unnamed protein product [Closterium sp. Yama58-4]
MVVQQDKYIYTPLSDVPAAAGQKVNVFGVVVLADNIRHSQGTDFYCTLLLADTTCHSPGYAVNLFAPRADQLPQVANVGDIIRIHRVMSTVIHSGPLGTARAGLGSAHALFSGAPGAPLEPYSFSHKTFSPLSDGHKQLVQQLRAWAHGFPFLIRPPTAPEPLLTISSIDADIAFDLCVQVWHVVKKDRMVVLFVWDGTDLPLPSLSAPAAPIPSSHVPHQGQPFSVPDSSTTPSAPSSSSVPEPAPTGPPTSTPASASAQERMHAASPPPSTRSLHPLFAIGSRPAPPLSVLQRVPPLGSLLPVIATCHGARGDWLGLFNNSSRLSLVRECYADVAELTSKYAERAASEDAHTRIGNMALWASIHQHTRIARSLQPYSTLRQIYTHPVVPYRFRCAARVIFASAIHPARFTAFVPDKPRSLSSSPAPPRSSTPPPAAATSAGATAGTDATEGTGEEGTGKRSGEEGVERARAKLRKGEDNADVARQDVAHVARQEGADVAPQEDAEANVAKEAVGKGVEEGEGGGSGKAAETAGTSEGVGGVASAKGESTGKAGSGVRRKWVAGLVLVLEDATGRLLVRLASPNAEVFFSATAEELRKDAGLSARAAAGMAMLLAMAPRVLGLLALIAISVVGCVAFSEERPTDQRILVLLDDLKNKDSYSIFFKNLADRGYELDLRAARDSSLVLQKYGEYLYDAAIILAPKVSSFGGVVDVAAILDFVDSGHDLILAADSGASDTIRDIALECGVDLDENPKGVVIDHQQYARVSGRRDDHTLVLGSNLINSSVILGAAPIKGPVLFQGIAMTVSPTSELVVPVLSGSPTAYAADPAAALKEPPALQGKAVSLVAAMQARNNARVLISGSLALFTDSFFRAVVDVSATSADPASQNARTSQWLSPAGNEQFVTELSKWTFHERGHLKAVNLRHNKAGESTEPAVYRVSDHLEFAVDIYEWAGSEWVPFKGDDVQVQFYMMSPYVLKTLSHDDKGRFFTSFQVPDVYGVFQFKVEHKRLGYSTISLAKQIPVRPFRHDEFERFIPAAFPYYASTFSMMIAFFVIGFVFLYHK